MWKYFKKYIKFNANLSYCNFDEKRFEFRIKWGYISTEKLFKKIFIYVAVLTIIQ